MDVLLDTNILARTVEPAHPHHTSANAAVMALATRGERLVVVPQVLYEYFVVCTRPQAQNGGLGMSNSQAVAELDKVRSLFDLLPDSGAIYPI